LECITIPAAEGVDGALVGSYSKSEETSPCPDSCSYTKDTGDTGDTGDTDVWCFKPGGPNYTEECPAPPPDPAVKSVGVFYEEDGVIIEQKDTFNNETGEARLSVPAHGNNSAIDVILQEGSMVTSSNDFCQLSDVPENIETGSMEANADSVVNSTADTTISKDVENVKYGLKINEGDLSPEETDSLSPSMKEACAGKTIVKMTVEETDEDKFNEMAAGGIVTIPQSRSSLSRVRRQTNTNCTNITRLCTSNDRSCWRWPYSTNFISIHHLQLNTLCVSCCDTSDSELCQCSEINSFATLSKCYAKSEGECALGTYECGSGDCRTYQQQCNGTCYGNNIPCGDECISKDHGRFSKQNCTTDGVTKCISSNLPCNGECPEGYFECGSECKPNYYQSWYQACGEKCISKYYPCNGSCVSGYSACGNRCIKDQWRSSYVDCDGTCQWYLTPCKGNCPDSTVKCGNYRCLSQDQQENYRECGDQCRYITSQCNGTCVEGYTPCGQYYCYKEGSEDEKYYRPCGDRCLWSSQFDDFYECNGKCISTNEPCGGSTISMTTRAPASNIQNEASKIPDFPDILSKKNGENVFNRHRGRGLKFV